MKKKKPKSLAKSMVMIPLYKSQTVESKKAYSRKEKHTATQHRDDA